jgi:putative sigma-54 modulation protein
MQLTLLLTKKLVDFVQDRMDKVGKILYKVVSADVFLKVEKTSDKENKIAEVKSMFLAMIFG